MPRYIEANDLVRAMTLQANRNALGEIAPQQLSYSEMLEIIADAPTADVAPKTEVERLERILNSYALQYGTVTDQQKVIDKAKREVAREIFEEIEKVACVYKLDGDFYIDNGLYAELKKKYTEDKK